MSVTPQRTSTAPKAAVRKPSPNLARQEEAEGRVKDSPRGNFMLAHPKDEWILSADGELLPVIVPLSKTPGVQGCDRRGNWGAARTYYLDRGFTLIPHDVIPSDYVAAYVNEAGQDVHRSVFQTPLDGPNGTVWTFDAEAWGKFVRLLRLKGYIKPPRPHIIRGMLHDKQREYDHLRPPAIDDASRRDVYDRRVKMLQRQLESLKAELEAAVKTYGSDASPVRGDIGDLLDAALAEEEPPTPKTKRKA